MTCWNCWHSVLHVCFPALSKIIRTRICCFSKVSRARSWTSCPVWNTVVLWGVAKGHCVGVSPPLLYWVLILWRWMFTFCVFLADFASALCFTYVFTSGTFSVEDVYSYILQNIFQICSLPFKFACWILPTVLSFVIKSVFLLWFHTLVLCCIFFWFPCGFSFDI